MSKHKTVGRAAGHTLGIAALVHAVACPIHGIIPLSLYQLDQGGVFDNTWLGNSLDGLHNGLVEKVAAPITAKFYENPYMEHNHHNHIDPNNPFAQHMQRYLPEHTCTHEGCNHGDTYKPEVYEDAHTALAIAGDTSFLAYGGYIGFALTRRKRPTKACKHKFCSH